MTNTNDSTSAGSERVPPQSIDAEVCVLGSMLLDATTIDTVVQILKVDQFYRPAHQLIFQTLVEMRDAGKPIDLVLLKDEMIRRGQLEKVGGIDYLAALVEGVPSSSNADYYAKIVRDKAILRNLILASIQIAQDAYDPRVETEEAIEAAEKKIFQIASERVGKEAVSITRLLEETFKDLEKQDGKSVTGVASGYSLLDQMTRGFQPGEMIVLAARPSMGKTSLLLNFLEYMSVIDKANAVIFSLEMSQKQLVMRLLASHAHYDLQKMATGRISPEDWLTLQEAAGNLHGSGILIDDSPELSPMQIRAKARRLKLQYNIQCILIDYLQLIRSMGRAENRQVEVADMSRSLKAMARELEVPVITAAQLNRKPADRPSHRPQMSDLRESGSIEQDADVVMLLHNEDYYHEKEDGYQPTGITELIVAKQRNGPTGVVPLVFLKGFTRFESAAIGTV